MSDLNNATHDESLNKVIADLLDEMDGMDLGTEEYRHAIDNLTKLMKIKNETLKIEGELLHEEQKLNLEAAKVSADSERIHIDTRKVSVEEDKLEFDKKKFDFEKEKNLSWRPSPDAIVTGAASILGILAILHYEKVGVITSKALSFVGKGLK